ncbi:MAG: M15 family metallopeptidase [Anaerolineae bacterium]
MSTNDALLQQLRQTPVPLDHWRATKVGLDNSGPYRAEYRSLEVREEGSNPLVDVSRYGLVSGDIYVDEFLAGVVEHAPAHSSGVLFSRGLLRETHARRLAKVDAFLRSCGLCLFIRSAWRDPVLQDTARFAYAKRAGDNEAAALFAPTHASGAPSPHSTGAAFDVELVDIRSGTFPVMRAQVNGKDVVGLYELEELAAAQPSHFVGNCRATRALQNRRILYHALCSQGVALDDSAALFVEHPGEFWHFGDGDPLSAYLAREPYARCGRLTPGPDLERESGVV